MPNELLLLNISKKCYSIQRNKPIMDSYRKHLEDQRIGTVGLEIKKKSIWNITKKCSNLRSKFETIVVEMESQRLDVISNIWLSLIYFFDGCLSTYEFDQINNPHSY